MKKAENDHVYMYNLEIIDFKPSTTFSGGGAW